MASLRMRMVLVILGLLLPHPQSFVIRKRSSGYDFLKESASSEDWLPGRPTDAVLLDPYSRRIYAVDDPDRIARDFMIPRPDDDYDLDDLEQEEEEEEGPDFDGEYGTSLIPDSEDDVQGELDGGGTLLNKSELESLFENDSDREKKLSIDQNEDRTDSSSSSSKSELTKEDLENILNPNSKTELRKVVTETKLLVSTANGSNTRPSYEGVRVVKVTEKDPNGETRRQKQTQWLVSPDLRQDALDETPVGDPDRSIAGRTWPGDALDGYESDRAADAQRGTRKVKRSGLSTTEHREDSNNEEGVSEDDQDDVELLKTYIRLQTEENRHLEEALNLAITAQFQVENSDEYLDDEIHTLTMAVENEEALETIRKAIRTRQQDTGEGEGEGEGKGKGEGEGEGEDDDEDLDGEGEQMSRDDDVDDEFSKRILKAKLKKFLIDSVVNDLNEEDYEDELNADGGEEEEEEEEDMEDDQRSPHPFPNANFLNPFTRNAFVEYRKPKRSEDEATLSADEDSMPRDTDDVDITDLLETPESTETEYCSAISELTDDCQLARIEGLVLDSEAVSLCNRHQICHLCGSVFGLTGDDCDRGYLGESERLCSGKEQCTAGAADLYLVMATAHRFTSAFSPYDVCAADCVYDYIVGEADDSS